MREWGNTVMCKWGNAVLRYGVIALLVGTAVAAPVPETIKETVKRIQTSNGFEPRDLFFTMEIALPKMIGDAEQCKEMARILKGAIAASETTAPAKTILYQYLIKVDAQADAEPLGETFASGGYEKKSEEACLKWMASAVASERLAGLVAYVAGYPQKAAKVCVDAVKDSDWTVRATAIRRLGCLDAKAFATFLPSLTGDERRIALEVVVQEKIAVADLTVRDWAKAGEEQAIRALAMIGTTADIEIIVRAPGGEKALMQMTQKGVDERITELLKAASTPEVRVALLNASALRNSALLPEQLAVAVDDGDPKVRRAAFRLLGLRGEASSFPLLLAKLGGPDTEAAENATRLMIRRLGEEGPFLEPLLERMKASEAVQDAVLKILSVFTDETALAAVVEALPRDAAVRALCGWQDANAGKALEKIKNDTSVSPTHRVLAERALQRLAHAITKAQALVYLDCGKETKRVKGKNGVTLELSSGKRWAFEESSEGTVFFDQHTLSFTVNGLKEKQNYRVSWKWWDYDAANRAQSLWAGQRLLLPPTALPSRLHQKPAETHSVVVPASAVEKGVLRLHFKHEGGANAVVSEIWLTETDETATVLTRADKPKVMEVIVSPEIRANPGAEKSVLILTGLEHHNNWRQITPILVEAFGKDKRLEVSVSEQPSIMTKADLLAKYDGYVMLYNNSDQKPSPDGALATLKKAVEGGKGLVLIHFSSGAFYDWKTKRVDPAFCEIAGRIWNPALRGHDPHGTFTVNIVDRAHVITKGLSDYEQVDELYTCLEGPGAIHVLASAISKVDKKSYPLAFILTPGKGRTFHCALGHSPAAFNEPTKQLFRQGVLWSIGLE
jgi:type 1 glutamine amidotransferase/HEAT repeat protein